MPYRIVETKLDPTRLGRVMEQSPLPFGYATEALARQAVADILATADRAGYDADNNSWWAQRAGIEIFSYAIEPSGPSDEGSQA